MKNQCTINFPTLERLWAFKLTIESEAYLIDVSKKSITCACSEMELNDAITNYNGQLAATASYAGVV